jgi:hypothetical protein
MELKTLKDIESDNGELNVHVSDKYGDYPAVFKNDLRQEAIIQIKYLENQIKIYLPNEHTIDWTCDIIRGKIDWIKNFFNITEEELR